VLGVSALFPQSTSARRRRPDVGSGDPSLSKLPRNDKDKSDLAEKKFRELFVLTKIRGSAGARQQLKVIFAISEKVFAFGRIGQKKIYRED
jgi:hypothetical protein